jgi:hypothetical protein
MLKLALGGLVLGGVFAAAETEKSAETVGTYEVGM